MLHVVNYSYVQETPGNSNMSLGTCKAVRHSALIYKSKILSISIFFWLFSYISDTCKHTALLAATCTFWWPLFELSAFHSKRGQLHFQMLFQLPSRSQLSNIRCSGMCRREMRQAVLPKIRGLTESTYKIILFFRQHSQHKINLFHNYWPCWSYWCCKIGLSWCIHSADKIQKIFPEHCLFVPRFVTLKTKKMCTLTKMKEHAIILQLFEGSVMVIRLWKPQRY